MKYFSLVLICTLLHSCGDSTKEKTVDMSEITPHSDRDYSNESVEVIDTIDYQFDQAKANELGMNLSGVHFMESPMFPDRFSPKHSKKLILMQEVDSTVFCQWSFTDSIKTKNAFYNWLDSYGPKRKSIRYGEKVNFQPENFVILINDTSMTYISSNAKMRLDDWLAFFENTQDIKDWKVIVEQGMRSKAKWLMLVDGEKKELIPTKK